MVNTAVVVYISPKVASNWTVWCLEPIIGLPSIRRLFERLQRSLASEDLEFYAVYHDEVIPARLEKALQGTGVKIFHSQSLNRLRALADFMTAHPSLTTILVF